MACPESGKGSIYSLHSKYCLSGDIPIFAIAIRPGKTRMGDFQSEPVLDLSLIGSFVMNYFQRCETKQSPSEHLDCIQKDV